MELVDLLVAMMVVMMAMLTVELKEWNLVLKQDAWLAALTAVTKVFVTGVK